MGLGHAHHHHPHEAEHFHGGGPDYGRAFALGILLNGGFVIVEAAAGFLSGSMALVADAGHNLSDVLGLIIAWVASSAAKRPASDRFTYGMKSSGMLAAFANGMLLLVAIMLIAFETVHRLLVPVQPDAQVMIWVAGIGIVINVFTALLFMRGSKSDINIRGAFIHMAADALVSVGVVLGGLAILFSGQVWIDPLISFVILAVIAWGTWGLLRDSIRMGLLAVPENIDVEAVRATLESLPGVEKVHDLHIWPMSSHEIALTAHLVMPGGCPSDAFLHDAANALVDHHGIGHTTLQVERGMRDCNACE